MKYIYIFFLILFLSCNQKRKVIIKTKQINTTTSKSQRIDLTKKKYFLGTRDCCNNDDYMIFEFKAEKDSLKGKVTPIRFLYDKPCTIKGTIKDSIFEFRYQESGSKNSIARGKIEVDFIKVTLNDYYVLTLHEIDYNTYHRKYLEVYPKLLTLQRDTIIGDYLFEIKVRNWNSRTHYGKSTVTIKDKKTKKEIQQIKSDDILFHNEECLNLYYNQDYNFDNFNDLSFSTGNNGPYGSFSDNYYIFDKVKKKFIRHVEYEKIANSLAFEIDTINKRMISHNRGSCCIHYTDAYKWKKDKLELVKTLTVDSQDLKKVILKKRLRGKMKTIIDKSHSSFTDKEIEKLDKNF